MFDWEAAEHILYKFSKMQLTQFLNCINCDDLYGLGYFCDPIEGVMLVANTLSYHNASFCEFVERWHPTYEETYRWDIGNWEYPGGLAGSSSEEHSKFDAEWEGLGQPISDEGDDVDQERLEGLCIRVLRRLRDDGVFSAARNLEGFMVLGPDDLDVDVLIKKEHVNKILRIQD